VRVAVLVAEPVDNAEAVLVLETVPVNEPLTVADCVLVAVLLVAVLDTVAVDVPVAERVDDAEDVLALETVAELVQIADPQWFHKSTATA